MRFYGVTTKFFDNGRVKANVFEIERDEKPADTFEETRCCDIYTDFFETIEEATSYRNDALRA